MCTRSEMKTAPLVCAVFCSCRKNTIHLHALAMKYELSNFGDSTYEFNVLIFTFKTGIKQYKDE